MIEGSCHCGAVHWRFEGIPKSATTCNCSICRRYGALWAYDYEGGRLRSLRRNTDLSLGTAVD